MFAEVSESSVAVVESSRTLDANEGSRTPDEIAVGHEHGTPGDVIDSVPNAELVVVVGSFFVSIVGFFLGYGEDLVGCGHRFISLRS